MLLAAFLVSACLSLVLTPWVRAFVVRKGILKQPADRAMHERAMPHLGGVAIALAALATTAVFDRGLPDLAGYLGGAAVILTVGIVDDLVDIRPWMKFLGQILAALILTLSGTRVLWLSNPIGGAVSLGAFAVPITVFWVVALENTLNLVDGLDGLAAGITAIAAGALAVVAAHQHVPSVIVGSLILAGSALGFLRYNFHPASIFMGDTGAMFLGYTLAALSVMGTAKGATAITLAAPVLALALPIFDTGFAIFRRVWAGRPLGEADRSHIHHRLVERGLGHRGAVVVLYGVALLFAAASVLLVLLPSFDGVFAALVVVGTLAVLAGRSGILRLGAPARPAARTKEFGQGSR
jgi:UDP-GlcNAc:undecaprenyl-phosphate GlcNAc-1-phosphate transferase